MSAASSSGPAKLLCTLLLFVLFATPSLLADATLSLSSASATAGSTVSIPLTLAGSADVVALQADVVFEPAKLTPTATTAGPALDVQIFDVSQPASGTRRILIYSLNNAPLAPGVIATLQFDVAAQAPAGPSPLLLTNVILAGTNGLALPAGSGSGQITINANPNSTPAQETLLFKQWDRSFGGTNFDNYPTVRSTPDGGCVLVGATGSGVSGNKTTALCGPVAAWVVKLDADGNKQWEQTVGSPDSYLYLNTIELTLDGGYILGGSSTGAVGAVSGNCGKTSPNFGGYDFWLVRLDATGQRMWDRSYGGAGLDALSAIAVLNDGGFVLAGVSDSPVSGNKTSPNFGLRDFWVVRTDASGNKLWDRSFGGTADDNGLALALTGDGGFLVSGGSSSDVSGNKTAPHYGLQDYWVVRLDANGNKLWDHSYGGSSDDFGAWMTPMPDGGAVLAGYTDSPISGTKTAANHGGSDYWVVRIDASGNQLWDRTFGGTGLYDWAYNVKAAADGGVLVMGESDSGADGNKTTGQFGGSDGWIVRLDSSGTKLAEMSLGGTDYDYIWSADTVGTNGFILAGGSFSGPSGNKTAPHWGDEDIWVVKLAERRADFGTPVVLVNGQFHPDNTARVTNSALIQIQSSSGRIYYTLNGAPPASGTLYAGPFVLNQPALVRAVALNANLAPGPEAAPVAVDLVVPPFIVTAPEGRTVGTGGDVALAVKAGGTAPLTYQWSQGGVNIPGATSPTLSLPNIQPNQGGIYSVVVSNPYGSTSSPPVLVVVFAPPTIGTQPTNVTVAVNGTASFFVSALGPPPLEYQWRKNGANIFGATNDTFTIPHVQFDDGSTYSVLVASPGGTLVSDPAVLAVTVPSPPAGDNFAGTNTIVGTNGAASGTNNFATREPGEPLHAGKPGSNSVWYTWIAPAQGIATFRTTGSTFDTMLGIYTGNNVANLTTVASDEDSGGFLASKTSFNATSGTSYHIAIDGLNGQQGAFLLRWDLVVTTTVVPQITCPPLGLTVQQGQNATFTVSATGPSLTYQWVFNGIDIPGATQASYTRTNVQPEHVGYYSVRVRSTAQQSVESPPAALEIGQDPAVQSKDKPDDVAATCQGTLKANATSTGASSVAMGSIGYQVLVSSSTNNLIDCNTTNCGGIPTGTRFLALQPTANGTFILDTSGSVSQTKIWVCRAGTNNLDRTRTYLKCDVDSAPDGRSMATFDAEAGRTYQVWIARLDNTNGVLQLNWKFGLPPRITSLTSDTFAPAGASMTLSVAATNAVDLGVTRPLSPPAFAWYFNGTDLRGTGANLSLTDLNTSDAGQYVLVAANDVGVTSAVVRLDVFGVASRAVVNAGGVTELFANATSAGCGETPPRYQWRLNGVPLTGETNRNLYLRSTQPAQAGQYSVTVSNCFGALTYTAATVAVTVDVGFTAEVSRSGAVVLRWQTTPGKHYRVEYRASIGSTVWTSLQPDFLATSASLIMVDSIGATPRFYRIVLVD